MKALMQMFHDDPGSAAEYPRHVQNLKTDIAKLRTGVGPISKGRLTWAWSCQSRRTPEIDERE
jgi:hypothetical protein